MSQEKHHVMAFARMNPITSGHEKVVNKVHEVAKENNADHSVILSHSHDAKKNPLSPEQKVKHAKNAFPGTNISAGSKEKPNHLAHASDLHKQGVTHLHVVAGSDRVESTSKLLNDYNGKTGPHGHYNFKKITVHSSGERDPDSEGSEGISASKMREHAASGNEKEFHKGAPSKMSSANKKAMYKDVRKGMGIDEGVSYKAFLGLLESNDAYAKSEENKKSADAAKKQGDMFAHHLHMADHHDNLSQWHSQKGRHSEADRHAEKAEEHHEKAMALKESINEAHKIGDKVIIHKGPRDVIGKVGHIGEIRAPWVGAQKRYTIDHDEGSIQLMAHHIKKYKEPVKEGYEGSPADERQDKAGMKKTGMTDAQWEKSAQDKKEDAAGEKHMHTKIEHNKDHKLITHGPDFSLKIGTEHHDNIKGLNHGEVHEFKCMDGNHWGVHKRGDNLHFAPHSLDSGISSNMSFHIKHSDFKGDNKQDKDMSGMSTYAQMLSHKAAMNPDLLSDAERQHLEAMEQMSEETQQIAEMQDGKSYSQKQLSDKIKSGNWEATHDIKPGKHVEMRHHTGKRVIVHVKEETIYENHVEFRIDHRDKATGDVKKTMADHEAKVSDQTDKATYFKVPKHKADSFKTAMKGHGCKAELCEEQLDELKNSTVINYLRKAKTQLGNIEVSRRSTGNKEYGKETARRRSNTLNKMADKTQSRSVADQLRKATAPFKEETVTEKLDPSMGAGKYIDDFQKSDAPQFKGKSKEKRRMMGIAAFLQAQREMSEDFASAQTHKERAERAKAKGHMGLYKKFMAAHDAALKEGFINEDHDSMAKQHEIHSNRHDTESNNTRGTHSEDHGYASIAHGDASDAHKHASKMEKAHGSSSDQYKEAAKKASEATNKAKESSSYIKFKQVAKPDAITEATVVTNKYSWGTMKTVHHGSDFSIPLHPEHHQAIAKLKDGQEHHFKDETGHHWGAYRRGDDVHFQSADHHGAMKTKVPHHTMNEEVEHLDEANHREMAMHGRMHPDMAKHMHVGNEMDFYGQGSGDKHHGKVLKNDGKEVHVKVTHNPYNPSDSTVHKFKVHTSLEETTAAEKLKAALVNYDKLKASVAAKAKGGVIKTTQSTVKEELKQTGPVDTNKVNAAGDKPHDEKWEKAKKLKKESVSFLDFINTLREGKTIQVSPGVRRHIGTYGSSYQGDDDDEDDDKPATKPASTEKRGRGRPKGAGSGARQKGSTAAKKKTYADYSGYKLHLPNTNK